jgi:hypothetical protein
MHGEKPPRAVRVAVEVDVVAVEFEQNSVEMRLR